jgi:hypothetical protein
MKNTLFIILLTITYSFSLKCTDLTYKIIPALQHLNHEYVLTKNTITTELKKDSIGYLEEIYKWTGSSKNQKLESLTETYITRNNLADSIIYSNEYKYNDIYYTENDSTGIFTYGDSGRIIFGKDTSIIKVHFIDIQNVAQGDLKITGIMTSKLYLLNDTLHTKNLFHYDSLRKPDSASYITINDPNDELSCISYKYDKDSLKYILDPESNTYSIVQHADTIIQTTYSNQIIKNFFVSTSVVFQNENTSIRIKQRKQNSKEIKNKYYDLKGRLYTKQIPYRVFF